MAAVLRGPLPSSAVAIDIGVRLQNAERNARGWAQDYHELVDLAWEVCDMNGWPKLEMTRGEYDGWTVVTPDDEEAPT